MQVERTLIFAGEDEASARRLLSILRARDIGGMIVSSYFYDYVHPEPCAKAIIMPDVPGFVADQVKAAFPGKYEQRQEEPKPASPLADLPMMTAPMPKRRGRPRKVLA